VEKPEPLIDGKLKGISHLYVADFYVIGGMKAIVPMSVMW
jgi:hypothetical protein